MEDLHRLLERQIRNSGLDLESNTELQSLIYSVNKTYRHLEKENEILESNSKVILGSLTVNKAKLQNTIESLDSFNYHVSHDLKTILINNLSLFKMLKKYRLKNDFDKVDDLVNRLDKNADKGMKLVEKYLQISKLETLGAEETFQEIEIKEIVEEVLDLTDLKDKLAVRYEFDGLSTVKMKESYITSIFQNLLTNAYKYRKDNSSAAVLIKTYSSDNNKVIEVIDNGVGIDLKKNAKKMFKPFTRIKNSKNQEGTGIGLFLVKKIINQVNGRVEIESELNKGVLVRIIL